MPTDPTSEFLRRFDLRYPIVQGPFGGGLSTPLLTATVSNRGGLGSYGAHILPPERIGEVTQRVRELTSQPFAMNLWVSDHDPGGRDISAAQFERYFARFAPYFDELGLARPVPPQHYHPCFDDQVEALLAARPPAFSFVFGIPSAAILAECRRLHIATIGAATCVAEARALYAAGVDLIVATGLEAGGHRPAFLGRAEDSLFGTMVLTPLVADRVRAPVIAAGGIADGRAIRAARALGAAAVQIGTAFLACEESGASDAHRAVLFGGDSVDTVLTRAFTGRLARGVRNRWTEHALDSSELAPFPVQSWFVAQLRAATLAAGRTDLVSLWSGQIAPNLRHRRADALLDALIADAGLE